MTQEQERYVPGYAKDALDLMRSRSAGDHARYLLLKLRPGMSVLDVGCGPGTITGGFADAVAPTGFVVGVDVSPHQIALARAASTTSNRANLSFETGSIYDMRFDAEAFHAVHAHALLEHVSDPQAALAEAVRVLQPGGVLAVCSSDWGRAVVAPRTPDVVRALASYALARKEAGGDPFVGRKLMGFVASLGMVSKRTNLRSNPDIGYLALGAYVATRLDEAARRCRPELIDVLHAGEEAALRWAAGPDGMFHQCWVSVTSRKPPSRRATSYR